MQKRCFHLISFIAATCHIHRQHELLSTGNQIVKKRMNSCLKENWDYNWDYRSPETLVYPPRNDTLEEHERYRRDLEKNRSTAVRHIFMIRHGEYLDMGNNNDEEHHLTERGRKQAKYTGKRLKELGMKWEKFITSTMTRARETSDIIADEIGYDQNEIKPCEFVCEGDAYPDVALRHPKEMPIYYADSARFEAAFRRYFYRAPPSQEEDSALLIVAHTNLIRYLVCRAVQLLPEAWHRFKLHHASMTWIVINPAGGVLVMFLGDSGYIPVECLTVITAQKNPRSDWRDM